jgi:type II secretory pathway component PulF
LQLLILFLVPHFTLLLPNFMQTLPYLTLPLLKLLQFVQIFTMLLQSSPWLCLMPRISMLLQPT